MFDNNLVEEMMDLRRLSTSVMTEKCLSEKEAIFCPQPRRRHLRQSGEHIDLKLAMELSDILVSKILQGSPPCYSGSPPIRVSNPLIQDAYFLQQKISEGKLGARERGLRWCQSEIWSTRCPDEGLRSFSSTILEHHKEGRRL